jgi:DNA-binding winged helix-turn-helix (wHTH) protein
MLQPAPDELHSYRFAEFEVDAARFELRRHGELQHVEPKVLQLLVFLLRNRARTVSKQEILAAVWPGVAVVEGVLTRAICLARKQLGDSPREPSFIRTVAGRGYRFVGVVAERGAASAPTERDGRPDPFVGREAECARIAELLKETRAGKGRIVLVAGEPGVGKTRLARESASRIERARVLLSLADEGAAGAPFGSLAPPLRELALGCSPLELRRRAGAGLVDLAELLPEIRSCAGPLDRRPMVRTDEARFRIFDAVSLFLARCADAEPIVLVLDDLHVADPDSLQLLRFLSRRIESSAVLILATYRDVGSQWSRAFAEALSELAREPHVRLALAGLPIHAVERLFVEQGSTEIAKLAATLHAKTGGNPLYLRELVRKIEESGSADVAHAGVSPTLQQLIAARVAALPASTRDALALASVVGVEFSRALVETAAGPAVAGVRDGLAHAARERLVQTGEGTTRLRFTHGLVREALYESLPAGVRARLHRRVAVALEAGAAEPAQVPAAELARHYREAALGGDIGKAIEWATRAGSRAMALLAVDEAATHYGFALEAQEAREPTEPAACANLALAAARAEWACARMERARELARRAIAHARAARLGAQLAEAATRFSDMQPVYERSEEAAAALGASLELLPDDQPALRARVLAQLSFDSFLRGDLAEQERRSSEAVAIARASGDQAELLRTLRVRAYALLHPRREGEWATAYEEAIALARALERPAQEFDARLHRLEHAIQRADRPAVDTELDELTRLAEKLRTPGSTASLLRARAGLAVACGSIDRAWDLAQRAVAVGSRRDTGLAQLVSMLQVGALLTMQDRIGQLRGTLSSAANANPRVSLLIAGALYSLAESGGAAAARGQLEELVADEFAALPRDPTYAMALANLALSSSLIDCAHAAEAIYAELLPYAGRTLTLLAHYPAGCASRYLGLLATQLRCFGEAEQHFETALVVDRRLGAHAWEAHVRIDYARMLLRRAGTGDGARANELLRAARAAGEQLGIKRLVREAGELRV